MRAEERIAQLEAELAAERTEKAAMRTEMAELQAEIAVLHEQMPPHWKADRRMIAIIVANRHQVMDQRLL